MTDEAITYYARKCFPNLRLNYGRACVIALLADWNRPRLP